MRKANFAVFWVTALCGIALHATAEEQKDANRRIHPPAPFEAKARHLTGSFVSSDGSIWVTAESGGIFRIAPHEHDAWTSMNHDGSASTSQNFYAILEDLEGRIWAGTDNQGISVLAGNQWKRYDRENALSGERIFDMALSPLTGEVAIATSGGVDIYTPKTKSWKHLSRASGLVSDQVESLCYTPDGELWLAYACGGVSKGTPRDNYTTWQTTQAPWYWDKKQKMRQPVTAMGTGLPSNLCNAITVDATGAIWVGTNSGLGYSTDKGKSWRFVRGRDYELKNQELYGGPAKGKSPSKEELAMLLPEDYVTCLKSTRQGLWVGFRSAGVILLDPKSKKILKHLDTAQIPSVQCGWVSSLVELPHGTILATTYGGGLVVVQESHTPPDVPRQKQSPSSHPEELAAPTEDALLTLCQQLMSKDQQQSANPATYWKEDWTTQGDWCERYGTDYAMLCAANAPISNGKYFDMDRKGDRSIAIDGYMGPHKTQDDDLRHWVHWINAPHNRNVLYGPNTGLRTEAEWDDHGEGYSLTFDGPDVWAIVKVPEGGGNIALYFFNPNGHEPAESKRDYLIEVRKYQSKYADDSLLFSPYYFLLPKSPRPKSSEEARNIRYNVLAKALEAPVHARSRVKDFVGSGVYKIFAAHEEGYYYIRVCRNYSFNTILNGVFLDAQIKNSKRSFTYFDKIQLVPPQEQDLIQRYPTAHKIWSTCMNPIGRSGATLSTYEEAKLQVYRFFSHIIPEKTHYWRWHLNIISENDRRQFDQTMEQLWHAGQEYNPVLRSKEFAPYSPRTIAFSIEEVQAMEELKIDWKQYLPAEKPEVSPEDMKEKLRQFIETKNK